MMFPANKLWTSGLATLIETTIFHAFGKFSGLDTNALKAIRQGSGGLSK